MRRIHTGAWSLVAAVTLTACGGGGGSSTAPATPASYGVGGTITGLTGVLVLQNNGADDLTVTSNGSFTFSRGVTSGAGYAVTVKAPPTGQTCTVSAGAGTATAAVTGIAIACAAAAPAFYVPAIGNPVAPTSSPPTIGFTTVARLVGDLYAFRADAPEEAPVRIGTDRVEPLGYALPYDVVNGRTTARLPAQLHYVTSGVAGGDTLGMLDLAAGGGLARRRIGSLTLGAPDALETCSKLVGLQNLRDASTSFVLLGLATDPTARCGAPIRTWRFVVARARDAATTAPVTLPPLAHFAIQLVYRTDGTLGGFVAVAANGDLNFYPDDTFASPVRLLGGVAGARVFGEGPTLPFGPSPNVGSALLQVSFTSGRSALYRVDATGAISASLYDPAGLLSGWTNAGDTVYFTDLQASSTALTTRIVEVGRSTGAARVLLTDVADPAVASAPFPIGVGDGRLVLMRPTLAGGGSAAPTGIDVIATPLAAPSSLTRLASAPWPSLGTVAGDAVYVDRRSGGFPATSYATEIVGVDGTIRQATLEKSAFPLALGGGPALQVRGITDVSGVGGGTLHVVPPGTASSNAPAMTLTNGSPYRIGTSSPTPPWAFYVTPTYAIGGVASSTGNAVLVIDTARGTVVPVQPAGVGFVLAIIG